MKTLKYLDPISTQTLREGIAELRSAEGAGGDAAENVAPELIHDIDVHDAIHVLFACPTSLRGEIDAHVWTAFGTTLRMRDMHRVNRHDDHRQVLADIGHGRLVTTWCRRLPIIVATVWRAIRMTKRWPASQFELRLDDRLCDLREEFGVRLPKPSSMAGIRAGAALRSVRTRPVASAH